MSTAGLVSGIERLARMTPRPQLAVSLNATTDAARSATMPVNRAWNLARLRQALDAWELKRHERFIFEYVLLGGVNDTLDDADRLAAWLGDLRHRHNVNLIPMNEHAHSAFREPGEDRLQAFATPPPRARLLRHRAPKPRPGRAGRLRPVGEEAGDGGDRGRDELLKPLLSIFYLASPPAESRREQSMQKNSNLLHSWPE